VVLNFATIKQILATFMLQETWASMFILSKIPDSLKMNETCSLENLCWQKSFQNWLILYKMLLLKPLNQMCAQHLTSSKLMWRRLILIMANNHQPNPTRKTFRFVNFKRNILIPVHKNNRHIHSSNWFSSGPNLLRVGPSEISLSHGRET